MSKRPEPPPLPKFDALAIGRFSGMMARDNGLATRPKAVDLFCGCGGFTCGIIQAGMEVVAAVDYDATAALTYMSNCGSYPSQFWYIDPLDEERMGRELMKHAKNGLGTTLVSGGGWIKSQKAPGVSNFFLGDIRKLAGDDILRACGLRRGELDVVAGSPPCQGYSTAGKRQTMDPRNSLMFEFARLVIELEPKTMMLENVPGILSMVTPDGHPVVDQFCRVLEDGGFSTVEAMKKTLAAHAKAGGWLRRRPSPTSNTKIKRATKKGGAK